MPDQTFSPLPQSGGIATPQEPVPQMPSFVPYEQPPVQSTPPQPPPVTQPTPIPPQPQAPPSPPQSPPQPSFISSSPPPFTPAMSPAPPAFSMAPKKSGMRGPLRLLIVFLVLGLIAAIVFGLMSMLGKNKSTSSGGSTVLTYWGLWEPENVMQEVISSYEQANPGVKINYIRSSQQDYRERLQNALAGEGGPDIFRFHNTWVPMLKGNLSAIPSDIYSTSAYETDFYPVTKNDLKLNNKYVGLPLEIDSLLLYYNEDLLRSAGKTPPETWDELLTTAQELTVKTDDKIVISGVAMGNSTNVDHWQDILALLMLQNGTDMRKPGSTIGSDGKNLGADALTFYTLFTKNYEIWDDTFPTSTQAFAAGKLALYFGPSWRAFDFAQNPSLKFSTVKTPKLSDEGLHYATYWADGVWEKSSHQKEAWQFLKYLTSKENMQKMYEAQSKTRLFGEPPSRVDMSNQFSKTPYVSTVLDQAPTATSWYLASNTWDGDTGLNSRISKYFEDAVTAVNKNSTSEEALKTVDQGVAQLLNQYAIR